MPQFLALVKSLSTTATIDVLVFLHVESAFVRALEQLDSAHVKLLSRFVKSANENRLGNGGSEFDAPVQSLNLDQIEIALPEYRDQLADLLA